MIKIENFEVVGMEHAIRGMRNPMNSWEKSDSVKVEPTTECHGNHCALFDNGECSEKCHVTSECRIIVGKNDYGLMKKLANGGPVHAKYRRMITVYLDITAPLYWWKEFDTYKVGTVANSCSTMHKIHEKEFTPEDFSCEHLMEMCDTDEDEDTVGVNGIAVTAKGILWFTMDALNQYRKRFLETGDKKYWWQMIQLLPSSYNQKRTIMLNYEVLVGMYRDRKAHKLDEWKSLCKWIEQLPYSEIITGERAREEE